MILDSHNHLGGPDKGDGKSQSVDEILFAMDDAGVDMAVVFPFNEEDPGVSFSRCNTFIADAAAKHPDRLTGFFRLDPNAGGAAVTELFRCVNSLGLKGIKLHPSSQEFSLEHPVLQDILAVAQEYKLIVLFDTSKKESPPDGIAALAARFPSLRIIMAHMNLFEETLMAAGSSPNITLQTTGFFNMGLLAEAVRRLGSERIMMGSDSPYLNMRREVEKVNAVEGLSGKDLERILGENFRNML